MKKSKIKLSLNKKSISNFETNKIRGGKDLKTFMAEGCGTSVHRPMCEAKY